MILCCDFCELLLCSSQRSVYISLSLTPQEKGENVNSLFSSKRPKTWVPFSEREISCDCNKWNHGCMQNSCQKSLPKKLCQLVICYLQNNEGPDHEISLK